VVRFLVVYEAPSDSEKFDLHYRRVHIPLAKKLAVFADTRSVAALLRYAAVSLSTW
jgi:uncharacterized protein (TIGR02118 family)